MAPGATAKAVSDTEEFECFVDLAGGLSDAQRRMLADILEAVRTLEANGDQAGLDELFRDAAAILREVRD